jgi:hypothetical protein
MIPHHLYYQLRSWDSVALCHTALRVAQPMRSVTSEASRTCVHPVQAQTLQRAQTLRGSDAQAPLCRL